MLPGQKKRRLILAPIIVALSFCCLVPAQILIDSKREDPFDELLLYLPNEKLLANFTCGLETVVADILWLHCIDYTAKHFREDYKFVWLDHMCTMITRLDPHFVGVYKTGGMFLSALKADADASIELLDRGARFNPENPRLPYEIAMVYLLNRRHMPESPAIAMRYLQASIATGNAPEGITRILVGLRRQYDLDEIEHDMWTDLIENSGDKFLIEVARNKLERLNLKIECDRLNSALKEYRLRFGQGPDSLQDLIKQGIMTELPSPSEMLGGRFFIDVDGVAKYTLLLDELMELIRQSIERDINKFSRLENRWPETLDELVETNYVAGIMAVPYISETWTYDHLTGEIKSPQPKIKQYSSQGENGQ